MVGAVGLEKNRRTGQEDQRGLLSLSTLASLPLLALARPERTVPQLCVEADSSRYMYMVLLVHTVSVRKTTPKQTDIEWQEKVCEPFGIARISA